MKQITWLALVASLAAACGSDSDEHHPSDASTFDGSGGGGVGAPCVSAASCPAGGSGTPVCIEDWPGGYCAIDACAQHAHDCPNDPGLGQTASTGSQCVLAPTPRCLALCGSSADCRDGYTCAPAEDASGHGVANVCVPDGTSTADGGMADGAMMDGAMMDGAMMDGAMMDGGGM